MKGIDWIVIGGRRWSRIIAGELCGMLNPSESVILQGDLEDTGLLAWWHNSPHKNCLQIVEKVPLCPSLNIGIALVANSAYLHYSSIESALNAGYNVISEKPLTFSQQESDYLIAKAEKLGLKLFSTNTYLFADYLQVFRRDWLIDKRYSHLHLDWADALEEIRYGERKGYDSSVPIIYDVLPHIASIILAVHGGVNPRQSTINVLNGGSEARVAIECDGLTITANLARNSLQRKRCLRFFGEGSEVALDFTEEPGKVSVNGGDMIVTDSGWDSKRQPIAEMLCSAKKYFEDGTLDSRLNSATALFGNQLIDGVADQYVDQQISFLNSRQSNEKDADFLYATRELISLKTRVIQHLPLDSPLRRLATIPQSSY